MKPRSRVLIAILFLAALVLCRALYGSLFAPRPSRGAGTASVSSGSHAYAISRETIPPRPPVNREEAMAIAEAERLRKSGYLGLEPRSEALERLLADKIATCRNCGYHTTNGLGSLCDYCAWMERYGGGLPRIQTTQAPAAYRPQRPASAPSRSDDPYGSAAFSGPEDFCDEYYDDFLDYEEAEDYWLEHN